MKSPKQSRRYISPVAVACLIVTCPLLVIALRNLEYRSGGMPTSLALGTSFGHATLIAIWTALGPWRAAARLPLCALWLGFIVVAWSISNWAEVMVTAIVPCAIVGQWLIAQLPLWLVHFGWGIGIRAHDIQESRAILANQQFGINELTRFTGVIVVLLGMAWAIVPCLQLMIVGDDYRRVPAIALVVITNLVMTLPLALAVLMPRHAVPASVIGLALVAFATASELLLFRLFLQRTSNPNLVVYSQIFVMNFCQVAWILFVLTGLRLHGYRLTDEIKM